MGSVVGRITEETPKYQLLKSTPFYEIRKYAPQVRAKVNYQSQSLEDSRGFRLLANYIFGGNTHKETKQPMPIAMTSPVLMEKSEHETEMVFVLPSSIPYNNLPTPNDERVELKEIPEQIMASTTFSGWVNDAVVEEKADVLLTHLADDKQIQVLDKTPILAQYNPPWTMPMCRTNEVHIRVKWLGD